MNVHQHIISGIKELLFLNDYLVLPNFGGFVLKSHSAAFSTSGNALLPPTKTLGFNIQLKQNDGILNQCLQHKLGCSAEEASQHLKDFAGFCNSVLQSKRRLSLNGIGFFYLDFENNTCFEPEHDVNFFTESFGLTAVGLKLVTNETPINTTFKTEDRTAVAQLAAETLIKQKPFNYRKVAYLTVMFGVLASFLYLLVNTLNVKGVLSASMFLGQKNAVYSPVQYTELDLKKSENKAETFVADNNGIALFAISNNKNIAVNVLDNAVNDNRSSAKVISGKYEIILGCFKKIKNAKRLVAKLKRGNINASIKEKSYKGMHVVSVMGINDKVEAVDQLEAIQNNYPKAWLKVN